MHFGFYKEVWADTLTSPAFMRTQTGLQALSCTGCSHFKFKQNQQNFKKERKKKEGFFFGICL